MKTIFIQKRFLSTLLSVVIGCFAFTACMKDEVSNSGGVADSYATTGNASGSLMVPPVSTVAMARHMGSYTTATNVWQYNVTWSGLSETATAVEVRGPADPGENGALLFTFEIMAPGKDGSAFGNAIVSEAQEKLLLANQCYYIVATASRPAGEIRGNISASAQ